LLWDEEHGIRKSEIIWISTLPLRKHMFKSNLPIAGIQPIVETKALADTLSQDHPLIVIPKKINWYGLRKRRERSIQ
jgi:hypothetical protein